MRRVRRKEGQLLVVLCCVVSSIFFTVEIPLCSHPPMAAYCTNRKKVESERKSALAGSLFVQHSVCFVVLWIYGESIHPIEEGKEGALAASAHSSKKTKKKTRVLA